MIIINHNSDKIIFIYRGLTEALEPGETFSFDPFCVHAHHIKNLIKDGIVTMIDEDDDMDEVIEALQEGIDLSTVYNESKSTFRNIKINTKNID